MREIKFRGKSASSYKWIHGSYAQVYDTDRNPSIVPMGDNRFFAVIPETVGQFTGLLDKNGKEVYEGDIVRWNDKYIGVIEWNIRMSGYYFMRNGSGFQFHGQQRINPTHGGLLHVEVIDNIHENPSLLEEN